MEAILYPFSVYVGVSSLTEWSSKVNGYEVAHAKLPYFSSKKKLMIGISTKFFDDLYSNTIEYCYGTYCNILSFSNIELLAVPPENATECTKSYESATHHVFDSPSVLSYSNLILFDC